MLTIAAIGCWFKNDMYSQHLGNITNALDKADDINMRIITSNCCCFSSAHRYGITRDELLTQDCVAIMTPYAPLEPSQLLGKFKYLIVKNLRINWIMETVRGMQFYWRARKCDILHFDQVLKSFGTLSFLTLLFLSRFAGKMVIVTIHELDPLQEKHKGLNRYYSRANKIIVFSHVFRDMLIGIGFDAEKIKTVPFCVNIEPPMGLPRDQFIFFGGHNLLKGKGYETLLDAIDIIRSRGQHIKVFIYTGMCNGLVEGKEKVDERGLNNFVRWSDFILGIDLAKEYQRSIACLVPYTSGSGRHPVTYAMANATPVIATNKIDLPEYLGEFGIYIKENTPKELADRMEYLMNNPHVVGSLGKELRKRAEDRYNKDVVGNELIKMYKEIYKEEL
jgi:glycosyltransferase involved in cell wall biosynthesis